MSDSKLYYFVVAACISLLLFFFAVVVGVSFLMDIKTLLIHKYTTAIHVTILTIKNKKQNQNIQGFLFDFKWFYT